MSIRWRIRAVAQTECGQDWLTSAALGCAFVAFAGLLFWFGSGPWSGALHAGSYGDLQQLTGAGQAIWHGNFAHIYDKDRMSLALPLSFIAMLPIAPILDFLDQPVTSHDLTTLLAGSYILLFGILVLHGVNRLARELGVTRRLWALQLAAIGVVLVPELEYGHLDDVLALVVVLHATRQLLRRNVLAACLLLSVAISCKQWAAMLVPYFVAQSLPGRRVRMFGASVALPALLAVMCVLVDGRTALDAFISPPPSSQLTGHPGISLTWIGGNYSELTRLLAAGIATLVGWRFRQAESPCAVLTVVAVVLLTRPLLETVNYSYYWSPSLLMFSMAGIAAQGSVKWAPLVWPLIALAWAVPRGLDSSPSGWWACQFLILGMMLVGLWRVFRSRNSAVLAPA